MGIRSIKELADLVSNRKVKVSLSREEKQLIKKLHLEKFGYKFSNTYCPPCWSRVIRNLAKLEINEPTDEVVKVSEKMVVNEPTSELTMEHIGSGWYQFSDGHKVRGKANAEEYLGKHNAK